MIYQSHSPNFAGETHCEAKQDDTLANWLCEKGLEGTFVGKKFGYAIYALDPTDPNSSLRRVYYNLSQYPTNTLDGDMCIAHTGRGNSHACDRQNFINGAICKSEEYDTCQHGTFTNGSSCEGNYLWTCARDGTVFSKKSSCIAGSGGIQSCYDASFTDHSYCVGGHSSSCYNVTFEDSSYCNAKVNGACKSNVKYDDSSFCVSEGGFCPTGSPKGTWDDANNTYKLDGWNGGCCNPAYMTSGECPSGATVCSE